MNREQIAATVAEVKCLMPELVPVVKELYEAGLIDGWRDVAYIGPHRPTPAGLTVDRLVLESAESVKERMKRGYR